MLVESGTAETYSGLFIDAVNQSAISSGSITVNTSDQTAFSGKVQLGTSRASFHGAFNEGGWATVTVSRAKATPITLNLHRQTAGPNGEIIGTVTDGAWTANVQAKPAFTSSSATAPLAGRYTVLVAASASGPNQPQGSGYGTVVVSKTGKARLVATLADGTKLSQSSALSIGGDWPIFAGLYKGQGVFAGWLTISNTPVSPISGSATWIKQVNTTTKLYSGGFTNMASVGGSAFRPPAKGTPILQFTTAQVSLEGGDLKGPLNGWIFFDSKNKLKSSGATVVKLSFANSSGLFHGTISDTSVAKPISFTGAVLQQANEGAGLFKGTSQYGSVWLLPTASDSFQVQTLGGTFSADIGVKSTPELLRWSWSDGKSSTNYPVVSYNFGAAAPRVQSLTVAPASIVQSINLGFDGSDGGSSTPLTHRAAENIGAVYFTTPLTGLKYWASSYAPITNKLDFTGFTDLEAIECFHCLSLTEVAIANLPSIKRVCFEKCPLDSLDLSGNPNLEDVRAALSGYSNIVLGGGTGPKVWHFCTRDNPQLTQDLVASLTNFYSLQELWIWNDNQFGAFTTVSTNLTDVEFEGNHYQFADFSNQANLNTIYAWGNSLTNMVLTGCSSLETVIASDNQFTTAALDALLALMDSGAMPNLQSVDLRNNPQPPSSAGYAHVTNLQNKGVTVSID